MTIADAITAFSALIAAISFVYGVSAWKREYIGKRRIELAETVLARFYEAEEAIRAIRNPMGRSEEGKSRQRSNSETHEQSKALDQAYVQFERRDKHRELFADLQSLKFRFMATFGKSASEPFKELRDVLNEMSSAANELGNHWWPREKKGQLSDKDNDKTLKAEATFWRKLGEDEQDKITQRITKAVQKTEELLQKEIQLQFSWWRRAWRWRKNGSLGEQYTKNKIASETDLRFTTAPS